MYPTPEQYVVFLIREFEGHRKEMDDSVTG
jgi:hypothetical protein